MEQEQTPSFRSAELEAKTKFAEVMLRLDDPVAAARTVQPWDIGKAVALAQEWQYDPEVIGIMQALLAKHGQDHYLPSKADLARQVYKIATGFHMTEEKLKALELYGKIMGHIQKPGEAAEAAPSGPVVHNTLVMIGTPSDWREQAREQQRKLLNAG